MLSFVGNNFYKPVYPEATAVVCHDAGAANIIIAGLKRTESKNWNAYMQGPAEKLWQSAFPATAVCDTLDDALMGVDLVITGTGWGSDIEHNARKLARARRTRSVAIIDHWVNYPERFIRHGETVWPDEIWVTDDYAFNIAKNKLPDQNVIKVPNYYLETQLREIAEVEERATPELLYILEPTRDDWGRGVAGEFQALDYFVSRMPQLELPSSTIIRLRPHPSEVPDKYKQWVADHSELNLEIDTSVSIGEAIGRSKWVIGCESFALVLALMSEKKTYCALPPWSPSCRLPHHGLIQLSSL